jgi:hypothetical protein
VNSQLKSKDITPKNEDIHKNYTTENSKRGVPKWF